MTRAKNTFEDSPVTRRFQVEQSYAMSAVPVSDRIPSNTTYSRGLWHSPHRVFQTIQRIRCSRLSMNIPGVAFHCTAFFSSPKSARHRTTGFNDRETGGRRIVIFYPKGRRRPSNYSQLRDSWRRDCRSRFDIDSLATRLISACYLPPFSRPAYIMKAAAQ